MFGLFRGKKQLRVQAHVPNFILNLGVDLSSSMEANGPLFAAKFKEMLNELSASEAATRTRIRVYEISGFSFLEKHRDKPVVYKRCDLETPIKVHRYEESEFRLMKEGGILRAGSPLKDGLAHLADRSLSDRSNGENGPIMIGMFADGYDRGSITEVTDLRRKLEMCREARIPILVAFFIYGRDYAYIQQFVNESDLKEWEFVVACYEKDGRNIAVESAFDAMSDSISNSTRNF